MGRLMNGAGASLRDRYGVSRGGLDRMAARAQARPGCWGARMTGGGFGGCAVALVDRDALDAFLPAVAGGYERQAQRRPALYVCRASAGAGPVAQR